MRHLHRPRSLWPGLVAILVAISSAAHAQLAGTGAAQAPGAISGVVVDSATKQPVRNAVVGLVGSRLGSRLTDDRGRFIFLGVTPGSYRLSAMKAGYFAPGIFAAPPPAVSIAAGQWVADHRVELVREGSISGTVVDERGEALVGAWVRVFAEITIAGRVQPVKSLGAGTDDRGVYRITGLPQGRYIVVVPSVQQAVPADTPIGVLAGQSVVQAAKNPGPPPPERPAVDLPGGHRLIVGSYLTPPQLDGSGRAQAYPITFYPDATSITASARIALGAGQQRTGVDFQLRPVPTWTVAGRIDGPAALVAGIPLRLLPGGVDDLGGGTEVATTLVGPDGRFGFLNVPAGRYTIDARPSWIEYDFPRGIGGTASPGRLLAATPGGRSIGSSGPLPGAPVGTWYGHLRGDWNPGVWIAAPLEVTNRDLTDVVVPVNRTGRISGRIEWERTSPPAAPTSPSGAPAPRSDLEARIALMQAATSKTTIRAEPADGSASLGEPSGVVSADQTFSLEGLLGGSYVLRVSMPASGGAASLKSIVWKGQDYTHAPFDATAGIDAADVVITLIDKTQAIRGHVAGVPAGRDGAVLAFPVDRRRWTNHGLQPALIRSGRVANDGTYQLTLPAGEFHLVAFDASHATAWSDVAFLEAAMREAVRVTLTWGETKSQALRFSDVRP
jgi:hypothetical protein